MSKNHRRAGDYAGAMEARGVPKVCGYRHRISEWGPCHGSLQRDHVDELRYVPWQNPKTARLVYACEHHHNCKTTEAGQAHRAKQGGQMTDTAPRLPKVKGATSAAGRPGGRGKGKTGGGWRRTALTVVGVAIVAAAVLSMWFNLTDPLVGALRAWGPWVVVCAIVFIGARYGPRMYRRARRARDQERTDWLVAQAAGIARKMQVAPDAVRIEPRGRGAWTREGLCVRGRVTYPAHVLDDDPKLRATVEEHWRHKLGRLDLVIEWNVGLNRLDYRLSAAQAAPVAAPVAGPPEPEPPADHQARADDKLRHVMESVAKITKGDWTGIIVRSDAIGPLEVEITWPPEFKAAADEARVGLMETINLGLPGRWRADSWDGESRRLRLTRRPKLERYIPNPGHAERTAWHLIPLGRDEPGDMVMLDVLSIPHALVVGATRRGKSVCLRTIIFAVLNPPKSTPLVDVPAAVLLDPKEIEFAGYEGMPGVVEVATEDKQMANAVDRVFWEMRRRYRWKKRYGVSLTKHRPIFLIIDEYQEFVEALNDAWVAKKGVTGKEHPSVAKTRRIARLGAAARIHLILATQRPDTDWFKGVLRENIQYRLAFGKLSPQASTMAFNRSDIGRDIPDKQDGQLLRGRGNTAIGDDGMPREFQAYWTPNPDPDEEPSASDLGLLDLLIPRQRDGLEEPMWDLDRLLAEFADDDDEDEEDDEDAGAGTSRSRSRTATKTRQQPPRRQRQPRQRVEDEEAVTAPVPPPSATRRTPAPPRPQQAAPVHLRALRLAVTCGTPLRVIDEGEAVQVVAVGDEDDEGQRLVTFRDAHGREREADVPADTLFEPAPGGDETSG